MLESAITHTIRQAGRLRQKWRSVSEPSFLGWLTMCDPAVAEIMVEWGYDGLIIDTEHSTYDSSALRATLMAFRGCDCVPIVRVGANDPYWVKQALDLGAGGVLIPLINHADEARAAVRHCRYAPEGARGVAPRRASNYYRDLDSYLVEANYSLALMLQIESETAVENLDSILEIAGIDCLFVGQADLSAALGHAGDASHPHVVSTIESVIRRCRRAGRATAVSASSNPAEIRRWLSLGANVLSFGSDREFMQAGFQAFRRLLEESGIYLSAETQRHEAGNSGGTGR